MILTSSEGPEGWSAPEFASSSGGLYFTSDRPGGLGGEDIWWVDVALIEELRP